MDDWTKKALGKAAQAWAGALLVMVALAVIQGWPGALLGAGLALMMSGLDGLATMRAEALEEKVEESRRDAKMRGTA